MKIFEKYKKIIFIALPFFIFLSGGLLVKYNLPKVVEVILKLALGPTISSQEIKFPKFGEIDIRDVVLSKGDDTMVKAPKIIIKYSKESLKKFRLTEINVENPWVHIERKAENVNIVNAFSSGGEPNPDSKAGAAVPIDIIRVKDGVLVFRDMTYSREIKQELDVVNGYVAFDKIKGIDLEFKGNKDKEIYEYRLDNLNEPLNMNIVLKDIEVKPELIQYGYDDKELSGATGIFNMDLTIASSGLKGYASLNNGTVVYDSLRDIVKEVNGDISFGKNGINVDFKYSLNSTPGIFKVFYSEEKGVEVNFKFKDLPYTTARSYKLLGDLNLPLDDLKFKSVDVGLLYKQDLGFKAEVLYSAFPLVSAGVEIDNINGKVQFKDGVLNLSGNELDVIFKGIDYKKSFTYSADLDLREENLKFDIKSNFIDFNGEYQKSEKAIKIYQKSELALSYDLEKQNLDYLNLIGKDLISDYVFELKATEENKEIDFEEISMINNQNQKVLQFVGKLNRETLKYNFKIHTKNFEEENLFGKLSLKANLDFIGQIAGEKDKFILRGTVKDFKLNSEELQLESYANISIVNNDGLEALIDGELRKIGYKNFEFEGIKIVSNYQNGKLQISDVRNSFFKIDGEFDPLEKYIDLKYKVSGLRSSELKNSAIDIIFEDVEGEIKGGFDNLKALSKVNKAYLETPNKALVVLSGDIRYEESLISLNNFKINQSLANVRYDIESKEGEFSINILEENLSRYYNFRALKYRVLSRVNGKIINGNIEAEIGINVDRAYLNGSSIPNLKVDLSYKKDELVNVMKINSLDIFNLEGKRVLFSKGELDFIEDAIDFSIPKQSLNLKDFSGMLDVKDMSGSIGIESVVIGKIVDPEYSLKLFDGEYELKGIDFDKISLDLTGNKRAIKINEILGYYENNEIKGKGEYNLEHGEYKLNVFSKNIDLTFLNAILPKETIKDISGTANIDVWLSSISRENSGYVDLIDFNANLPSTLLDLKKLNMVLKIDNERLTVNSLAGLINKGEVKGSGYLKLPSIEDIKADDEFYKELDYAFNLTLKNVIYELKDYFKIDLSTNLSYSENKVSGNIIVNDGEITGILKEDKGLILTILNFIIDKTRAIIGESKRLGQDFEIKGSKLDETPEFNVGVMIKDGIIINIPDISTFAQDVQGVLMGRFNLVGKNDKISVLGELEIQKGSFVLGSEDFRVTRALLLSDKKNGFLSNFNPNLIFDISSLTANGNVEISLQGELNSLRLNILTNQGSESSSLKNIFDGEGDESDKSIVALLFKTLIDSQISSTLLRPISKTIKDTFHISKFRIVSDVFNQEVLANSDDPRTQDPNVFGFGAYLEAENPIYRDKYFWVLKLGIIDGSKYEFGKSESDEQSNEVSNSVNQFDFKVERRYRSGWSYGVGVSKLNEENMIDEDKKGNLNYYVDFKFERKYNSIKDIFSK